MVKKIVLAVTFVAAFSAAGLSYTTPAHAWRAWGAPGVAYYGGPYVAPRTAYYAPYNTYYNGPVVGGPVVVAPRPYRPYRTYYAGPDYYYSPGVSYSYGY